MPGYTQVTVPHSHRELGASPHNYVWKRMAPDATAYARGQFLTPAREVAQVALRGLRCVCLKNLFGEFAGQLGEMVRRKREIRHARRGRPQFNDQVL